MGWRHLKSWPRKKEVFILEEQHIPHAPNARTGVFASQYVSHTFIRCTVRMNIPRLDRHLAHVFLSRSVGERRSVRAVHGVIDRPWLASTPGMCTKQRPNRGGPRLKKSICTHTSTFTPKTLLCTILLRTLDPERIT